MEKGIQWGNFVELKPMAKDVMAIQVAASKALLNEMTTEWFKKEEFKGLGLTDFKVELIFRDPNDMYPGGTVGLKITKK